MVMYEFTPTTTGWRIHWGVSAKSNPKTDVVAGKHDARRFNPDARPVAVQRFEQKESGAPKVWPFATQGSPDCRQNPLG
jgi:hypothetical protein